LRLYAIELQKNRKYFIFQKEIYSFSCDPSFESQLATQVLDKILVQLLSENVLVILPQTEQKFSADTLE
jgi:hypothetical protein